jgi:hypothetical protein
VALMWFKNYKFDYMGMLRKMNFSHKASKVQSNVVDFILVS